MIEIILLIVGIFKAVRRPKLSRLTAQYYPDVDPAVFAEWQQAQLKATDIFLWATWGAFFIKLLLLFAARPVDLASIIWNSFMIIVGWIIGLIIASIHSGRANRLRLAAGINWPK